MESKLAAFIRLVAALFIGVTSVQHVSAQSASTVPSKYSWTFGGNSSLGGCWDGKRFAIVTDYGSVGFSNDGTLWSYVATGATTLSDIAWTGTGYVACGSSGIISSVDGVKWTQASTGTEQYPFDHFYVDGSTIYAYGGAKFISLDKGATIQQFALLFKSTDGVNWQKLPPPDLQPITGFLRLGSRYLAMTRALQTGGSPGTTTTVYVSTDLVSWTLTGIIPAAITRLATDGNSVVAVGYNQGSGLGVIYSSASGIAYTARFSTSYNGRFRDVTWVNGRFVAVEDGGNISFTTSGAVYSTDGVIWTEKDTFNASGYGFSTVVGHGCPVMSS